MPSWVSVMRRVVRTKSLTPKCDSKLSKRRPMIAGATPSALAAAVKLPFKATDTKGATLSGKVRSVLTVGNNMHRGPSVGVVTNVASHVAFILSSRTRVL